MESSELLKTCVCGRQRKRGDNYANWDKHIQSCLRKRQRPSSTIDKFFSAAKKSKQAAAKPDSDEAGDKASNSNLVVIDDCGESRGSYAEDTSFDRLINDGEVALGEPVVILTEGEKATDDEQPNGEELAPVGVVPVTEDRVEDDTTEENLTGVLLAENEEIRASDDPKMLIEPQENSHNEEQVQPSEPKSTEQSGMENEDRCDNPTQTTPIIGNHEEEDPIDSSSSCSEEEEQRRNDENHPEHCTSNDPADLKSVVLTPQMVQYLSKRGPAQVKASDLPDQCFPKNKFGRSFQESWYYKTVPGGEKIHRDWLSYSISEDRAYCLHCILFGKNTQPAWTKSGFNAWSRVLQAIMIHETSDAHVEACLKAKIQSMSLPILPSLEEAAKRNRAVCREIVKHVIDITLYLGRHCLAFRGHREGWKEDLRGNFRDLTVLLAKYSPAMASYIAHIESAKKKRKVNLLSWNRQNQMIDSVATYIKRVVVREIKEASVFSVSIDTTFDFARMEQLSFIVRYVENDMKVVERLLAMKQITSATGEDLFTVFKSICEELGLNWKKMLVGQSYDGALSMSSMYKGLQGRILTECPSALFVWCGAHRLNLVVVDLVSCSVDGVDMFGSLEALFVFVSSSKKRASIFTESQKKHFPKRRLRRLKRVDTTRWWSHDGALEVVMDTFPAIIDTLDPSHYLDDRTALSQARGLRDYLLSRRFVLTALSYKRIFDIIAPVSSILQSPDLDLLAAVNIVDSAKEKVCDLRSDAVFESILDEKERFVEKYEELDFAPLPNVRQRRKKLMPGEIARDEPVDDPVRKFKVDTFFLAVDRVTQQLKERFCETSNGVFKDLSLFSKRRIADIAKASDSLPSDAFEGFCALYHNLVSREDLKREYLQFSKVFSDCEVAQELPKTFHSTKQADEWLDADSEPEDEHGNEGCRECSTDEEGCSDQGEMMNAGSMMRIFEILVSCGLKTVFPALYKAMKISLTLPVSSATCERCFSKLKIIKNRLRTTMCNNRLESLMLISCEHDITVNYEEVIEIFKLRSPLLEKLL